MKQLFFSLLCMMGMWGCTSKPKTGVTFGPIYKVYIANNSAYEDTFGVWHVNDAVGAIETLMKMDSVDSDRGWKYMLECDSLLKVVNNLKKTLTIQDNHGKQTINF